MHLQAYGVGMHVNLESKGMLLFCKPRKNHMHEPEVGGKVGKAQVLDANGSNPSKKIYKNVAIFTPK